MHFKSLLKKVRVFWSKGFRQVAKKLVWRLLFIAVSVIFVDDVPSGVFDEVLVAL